MMALKEKHNGSAPMAIASYYAFFMLSVFLTSMGCILFFWAGPMDYQPLNAMLASMAIQIVVSAAFLYALLEFEQVYNGTPPVLWGALRRESAENAWHRWAIFRRYAREGLVCLAIMVSFSWAWLSITSMLAQAQVAQELQKAIPENLSAPRITALLLGLCLAPFVEEIIFRGVIMQTLMFLAGWMHWGGLRKFRLELFLPVFITSLIWASLHVGMIEPAWVKYVQVTGLGMVLGLARLRMGLVGSIALHLAFNIFGGLLPVPGFTAG
jgi:membrane protease YdiL (CAAX protease family)